MNSSLIRRLWLPLLVGLSTVAATVALWQRLHRREQAEIRVMTQSQTLFVKNKIETQIGTRIWALQRLAKRWEIWGKPSEVEWESDALLLLSGYRGSQATEWVDADFHARWVAPLRGNQNDIDLDFGSSERRRIALDAALDMRQVVATRTVALSQGGHGFLICVPILTEPEFSGFVVGVFRYQQLFESILEDVAQDYGVALFDGDELIYSRNAVAQERRGGQEGQVNLPRLSWRMRVWPRPETLARAGSPLPQVTLVGGLIAAVLLAFAVYQAQTAHLRAQEIAAGNEELRKEIAERKQAEGALRRSEAKYRSLVDGAPYGIFRLNPAGKLAMVNPALVEMLGYDSDDELYFRDLSDLFLRAEDEAQFQERVRERENFEELEATWKRKDGTPITVQLSGRTVRDAQGELEGLEVMAEDVTERRALEGQLRQAQKMEAVGTLAGGMAHGFNNLLMVIRGHTELVLNSLVPGDPLRRNAIDIRKAVERAASLTRQLLAFGRKQVLQPKVLDLNALVTQVSEVLPPVLGDGIEIDLALDPTLGRVKADPGQIEQVIMNLVFNARDAMADGGTLTIATRNVDLDETAARRHPRVRRRRVVLAVSDTGCGMDEEVRSRIFEPFFSTKDRDTGTGLGLATVYGTVEQSGGSIGVWSEPGQGTTISIYLPRVDEPLEPTEPPREPVESLDGFESILVVEDDDSVRRLTREFLKIRGYTVLEAQNAAEAIQIAERYTGPIHLMLTDVVMPGMRGGELVQRVANLRPDIRVLYMSAYTEDAILHFGMLDPGTAFIEKPFSPDDLAIKVREVLEANAHH